jgi:type VI secretion system secreted protein VgrG
MSDVKSLMFSHNHNLLKVRGCKSLPDVLCFEGHEALSEPFSTPLNSPARTRPSRRNRC